MDSYSEEPGSFVGTLTNSAILSQCQEHDYVIPGLCTGFCPVSWVSGPFYSLFLLLGILPASLYPVPDKW